jgi:glycosyltransferase involved in cell wall biosynthesis
MKRLLLVMSQPPGCNGVQASMFDKLLPFLESNGWEFHFAGPSPQLFSVLVERLDYPRSRLHYSSNVSASRCFSVRKNRLRKGSFLFYYNAFLQFLAQAFERITGHDSRGYMQAGIAKIVRRAEDQWNYDIIAGLSPDFEMLELVSPLAKELKKPFFVIFTDPYGTRQENAFIPRRPDVQQAILDQACGVFFTSPLTRQRYVEAGLIADQKAYFFVESYPESPEFYHAGRSPFAQSYAHTTRPKPLQYVYLGMLPEWRPLEPFLMAMKRFCQEAGNGPAMELRIHGFLYPSAKQQIKTDPLLSQIIHIEPILAYAPSHWVAEDSDVQLVIIGPRHVDNLPSKFFDYLGHKKPVLVLGPKQNPLREILLDLQIGCYVDGLNADEILDGLRKIKENYSSYQQAFHIHAEKIAQFSTSQSAKWFTHVLDQSLDWQRQLKTGA